MVAPADRADRQAPLLRIAVRPVRSIFLAFFGSIRIIIFIDTTSNRNVRTDLHSPGRRVFLIRGAAA